MNYLIVIDMQNDFITGVLGSEQAQKIVPAVVEKVKQFDGTVLFTRDTHGTNYKETQEGNYLPVMHCIEDTAGWQLIPELAELQQRRDAKIYDKPTFGSLTLAQELQKQVADIETIELIGVCTDICVVSNALLLKAALPEIPIYVDPACCAGTSRQNHEAALTTMQSCQVQMR